MIRVACLVRVLPASLGTTGFYPRLLLENQEGAFTFRFAGICFLPHFTRGGIGPGVKRPRRRRRAGGGPARAGRALLSPSGVNPPCLVLWAGARESVASAPGAPRCSRECLLRAGLLRHPRRGPVAVPFTERGELHSSAREPRPRQAAWASVCLREKLSDKNHFF